MGKQLTQSKLQSHPALEAQSENIKMGGGGGASAATD